MMYIRNKMNESFVLYAFTMLYMALNPNIMASSCEIKTAVAVFEY